MKQCKCGSYAFNLYKEDIDQGNLCDVHYWKEKALAQQKQEPSYWLGYGLQAYTEKPFDDATPLYTKSQL